MELNLFKNNNENDDSHNIVGEFINELTSFINNNSASAEASSIADIDQFTEADSGEQINKNDNMQNLENKQLLDKNHKEGHLYFVTYDRNNQIYLWDFTDKPEYEFEEKNIPPELQDVAKEGAMLKYENGTFVLYSEEGYDMLFEDE